MTALPLVLALLAPPQPMTCSWYGPGFHGRLTASGATYNQNDYTAAHCSLPFGTRLGVLYQGRAVCVTVTDRGPWAVDSTGAIVYPLQPHPVRDLDLSAGAMKALGGIEAGVITAHVWRIE